MSEIVTEAVEIVNLYKQALETTPFQSSLFTATKRLSRHFYLARKSLPHLAGLIGEWACPERFKKSGFTS